MGTCFLSQLEALVDRLNASPSKTVALIPVYIGRSDRALRNEGHEPLSLQSWQDELHKSTAKALQPVELAEWLARAPGPAVLVDNSSSQALADQYPLILRRGINIVTPNKKSVSGEEALWDEIWSAARPAQSVSSSPGGGGQLFHESTVGAGLPIISTLNELVATGDTVRRIEGVFSGTLSYIFNSFMPADAAAGEAAGKFSDVVTRAKALGYTEPDPREDLNGLDVARKLTILARLGGLRVQSPTSFPVESLVPAGLEGAPSVDAFLQRLPDHDDLMDRWKREAAAEGKVLRYVGSIDFQTKQLTVGLQRCASLHLFSSALNIEYY